MTSDKSPEASHIVMVPPGENDESPQAYVFRARIEGFPITALCGYTWVPHRDPQALPVCATCKGIFENDPFQGGPDDDDRGRLPDA